MGLGGATRNLGVSCNATSSVAADNIKCINTPIDGVGYSSYFALDVTTPATPTFCGSFPMPASMRILHWMLTEKLQPRGLV